MAEEQADKEKTPDQGTSDTGSNSSSDGGSALARLADDPYLLLTRSVYVFFVLGVLFVISDILAFPASARGQFIGVFNDSFNEFGRIGLVLGIIVIINALRRRRAGLSYEEPPGWGARLRSPEWLFQFAIPLVAVTKLVQLILELSWSDGDSDWDIWALFFSQMFTMVAAILFLYTMKAVANAIELPSTERPAPSGAADEDEDEKGDSEEAETSDSAEAEPSSPSMWNRIESLGDDPTRFLTVGIIVTAYLGLFNLIFSILQSRQWTAGIFWEDVFGQIALLVGVVSVLLVARLIVTWVANRSVESGPIQRSDDESVGGWLSRLLAQPRNVIDIAIAVLLISGCSFAAVDIWSDRNDSASDFWSTVLRDGYFGLAALGTMLLIRMLIPMMEGGMKGFKERAVAASKGPLMEDPGRMLKLYTYLLVYVGLAWICVTQISIREWAEGWDVWYMFLLRLIVTALRWPSSLATRCCIRTC